MERRIVFMSGRPLDGETRDGRVCSGYFSNDDRSVWVDGLRFERIPRWPDVNFREVVTRRLWWIAPPRFVGLHAPFEYEDPSVDADVVAEFEVFMRGTRLARRALPFNRPRPGSGRPLTDGSAGAPLLDAHSQP